MNTYTYHLELENGRYFIIISQAGESLYPLHVTYTDKLRAMREGRHFTDLLNRETV